MFIQNPIRTLTYDLVNKIIGEYLIFLGISPENLGMPLCESTVPQILKQIERMFEDIDSNVVFIRTHDNEITYGHITSDVTLLVLFLSNIGNILKHKSYFRFLISDPHIVIKPTIIEVKSKGHGIKNIFKRIKINYKTMKQINESTTNLMNIFIIMNPFQWVANEYRDYHIDNVINTLIGMSSSKRYMYLKSKL